MERVHHQYDDRCRFAISSCVNLSPCVCVWSVSRKAYGPTQHVSFEFGGVILVDPRQHIYPATGGSLHTWIRRWVTPSQHVELKELIGFRGFKQTPDLRVTASFVLPKDVFPRRLRPQSVSLHLAVEQKLTVQTQVQRFQGPRSDRTSAVELKQMLTRVSSDLSRERRRGL